MARIVLGIGSSHTPQLSTTPDWWSDHATRDRGNPELLGRDGNMHSFDEIVAVPEWTIDESRLTEQAWSESYERAQHAVATLADELAAGSPDALVVIGDDQAELFLDDGRPVFAVYWGESIDDFAPDERKQAAMPAGLRAAMWATHSETGEAYPVPHQLGRHIIERLAEEEFDVASMTAQPQGRSLGHAFTFPRRRLMGEMVIPLLPVLLNSYYAPNQPSPRRSYLFGRALRRAIESFEEDITVGIVASGGLSHFVVDEELDNRVLQGLQNRDFESLATIPRRYMRSGTSESLNWIAAGGALENLSMKVVDYVPAYRSVAGTGVGMAFAVWR